MDNVAASVWKYRVCAVSLGNIYEVVREYDYYKTAKQKLMKMNMKYYKLAGELAEQFIIVAVRAGAVNTRV